MSTHCEMINKYMSKPPSKLDSSCMLVGQSYAKRNVAFSLHRTLKYATRCTVVPVFRGLCDQGTPAVSGQYNDVRGDFQYKLTLDQGTPANADADRHLFVIFAPQPGDSALFILFFITLGRKRYQISLLMLIESLKRMSTPAAAYPEK